MNEATIIGKIRGQVTLSWMIMILNTRAPSIWKASLLFKYTIIFTRPDGKEITHLLIDKLAAQANLWSECSNTLRISQILFTKVTCEYKIKLATVHMLGFLTIFFMCTECMM